MIEDRRNSGGPMSRPPLKAAQGLVLAIDASGAACSAALWRRDKVVAHRHRAMARGHAEALMPMIVETMTEADETLRTLDAVAVTVGPGAFTGLRVGLAAARGIGLAASVPVIGVTTFAAVAEAIPEAERRDRSVLVLLDSRRGDIFAQRFSPSLAVADPPIIIAPAAVPGAIGPRSLILVGDGVDLARPHLDSAKLDVSYARVSEAADAAQVARLAVRLIGAGQGLPPTPLYLRAPEVRMTPTPHAHAPGFAASKH